MTRRRHLHFSHPSPNVHLSLHLYVLEGLLAEPVLSKRSLAACDGALCGAVREDAVHAGLAHFVVAFGVHEEAHVGVQVA